MSTLSRPLSRRRLLTITAAACLSAPFAGIGSVARAKDAPQMIRWTGRALGAEAEIRLHAEDPAAGREALAQCVDELTRLESALNLFDPNSALARLNRDGVLENPPLDLVRAIADANAISAASEGTFDITIQPVWQAWADSLTATGKAPADLDRLTKLVDWRLVEADPARIRLPKPGMALTLNGIGQGYITDRVAELLMRQGYPHVLVDLGELRAPAGLPDGSPWSVAVRDPNDFKRDLRRLSLANGAMATSEAFGSSFRLGQHDGHILYPNSGRRALDVASVTVMAPTATIADGLSTAIAVAGSNPDHARAILKAGGGTSALLMDRAGKTVTI